MLHQCLPLGWRELSPTEASTLRARFGIDDLTVQRWGMADSIRRAANMLDKVLEDLGETVDHPPPNVRGTRGWVHAALAVLAPYRTASAQTSPDRSATRCLARKIKAVRKRC